MPDVVHSIHFPVSARAFVLPIVHHLNRSGIATELWLENQPKHQATIDQINCPKRFVESDLTFQPIAFLTKLYRYCQQLQADRPRILHTHQARASLIPLLAAFLTGVPIRIYQNHGLPYLGYRGVLRSLLRALEWINIRLATHVLLVSHSNREAAIGDRLLRETNSRVLAQGSAVGIDLAEFDRQSVHPRGMFSIDSNAFVLGYIGRPVKRKGFHRLLEAWERSRLSTEGHVLLIAGCSMADCETVMGRKIPGVKALGYLTDLRDFYAACDVVTLPSDHEGFPYSMLEGAAAGKPLIGTDIPGIRCTIWHNQTGLLIPPKDVTALMNAIVTLATDPIERLRLGTNARRRVEQEFTREIVLDRLLEFYTTELQCVPRDHAIDPSQPAISP